MIWLSLYRPGGHKRIRAQNRNPVSRVFKKQSRGSDAGEQAGHLTIVAGMSGIWSLPFPRHPLRFRIQQRILFRLPETRKPSA